MQQPIVFSPEAELSFETVSSELARFLTVLNAHPMCKIVLDLGSVLQCDSAGLALLIEAKRISQSKKHDLQVKNMSDAMLGLATFCGVSHLFLGELADD